MNCLLKLLLLTHLLQVYFIPTSYCQVKAHVQVREAVIEGKPLMIDCIYDLAGRSLYSINWRFKGKEFLRILRVTPPQQVSPSQQSVNTANKKKKKQNKHFIISTSSTTPDPFSQMNGVFTHVPGIQIDVSMNT